MKKFHSMKLLSTKMIFLMCLAFLSNTMLFATASANTQSDQHKVRKEIKQLNQQINRKKAESDSINAQVTQLEKDLGVLSNRQHTTKEKITVAQRRLINANKKREQLQDELKQQQGALAQQLQAMHTAGEQSHLRLLLLQDNPAEISRNIQYFNYLNRYRSVKITEITRTKRQLTATTAAAKKERSELKVLQEELKQQEKQVSIKLASRENALQTIKSDLDSKQKRMRKLVKQEKALQQEIDRIARQAEKRRAEAARKAAERKAREKQRQQQANNQRPANRNSNAQRQQQPTGRQVTTSRTSNKPFSKMRGKLSWPVGGRVIHRYNSPRNEKQRWTGVVIAAPGGAKVRAVAPGKVVFAGWMNGYGHLIIIEHDRSYLSLYGYNRAVFKRVGQQVNANEVIAAVGNSSGQSRNALYFEIRRGTKPQNPARWLR